MSGKELYDDIVCELTNFEHADEDPEMAESDWAAVFYDLLVKVQNSIDIGDLIIREE